MTGLQTDQTKNSLLEKNYDDLLEKGHMMLLFKLELKFKI